MVNERAVSGAMMSLTHDGRLLLGRAMIFNFVNDHLIKCNRNLTEFFVYFFVKLIYFVVPFRKLLAVKKCKANKSCVGECNKWMWVQFANIVNSKASACQRIFKVVKILKTLPNSFRFLTVTDINVFKI